MQEPQVWNRLIKHLSGTNSPDEEEAFTLWLNQDEKNNALYEKVKAVWTNENNSTVLLSPELMPSFLGRFSRQKMKDFVVRQAIGKLIGFTVGMWVTGLFSHQVLEKRRLSNLFGLNGRKQVQVNDIPEWMQNLLAILLGFLVLEVINHFFQTKKYLIVWGYIKRAYTGITGSYQTPSQQ